MDKKTVEQALEKLMSSSKKRNFVEAIELIVSFKSLNIKNKDHRFNYFVNLPHPYKKKIKSLVFVKDKNLSQELKGVVDKIIMDDEISKISKKDMKKLAAEYDVFLAEGPVMLTVGKYLGQILSPRGKMPTVAPPNVAAIKSIIDSSIAKQKISNKKNKFSVALQTKVGKRDQSIEDLSENILSIYNSLLEKLPAGKHNIKSMFLKTTMGSPVKIGEKNE